MDRFVPSGIPTRPHFESVTLITLFSSKTAKKAKHAIWTTHLLAQRKERAEMNKSPKQAKRSECVQMPDSVRMAYETAAKAAWVSAQEVANEKAEAAWQTRSAISQKRLEEMTAACAAQAEEAISLRAKLIDVEAKAAAATSATQYYAANVRRRLKEITVEAQRALQSAELVASHAANLEIALDAAPTAAELFPAEINVPQTARIAACYREGEHSTGGETTTSPTPAAVPLSPDSSDNSRLKPDDVIAATRIILTAASRLQAIGVFAAAYQDSRAAVCDCDVEQSDFPDSPVGHHHHGT
jgi:hypothetical protein